MERRLPGCSYSEGYYVKSKKVRELREEMLQLMSKTLDSYGINASTVDNLAFEINASFSKVLGSEVYR